MVAINNLKKMNKLKGLFLILLCAALVILWKIVKDVEFKNLTFDGHTNNSTISAGNIIPNSKHSISVEKIIPNNKSSISVEKNISNHKSSSATKTPDLKYILQWTSPRNVPFVYMGKGQQGFIDRKCPHVNCFVTADRNYLDDVTMFDAIAFAGPEVVHMWDNQLPDKRSPHQKYAFASIESSDYYPICSNRLDGYFNWTWTFRLDSEVRWGYFTVKDKNKNIIGPNKIMHWMKLEDMDSVSNEFKEQLKSKTNAAAWFVSNCNSKSSREKFVSELQGELKKYNHTVDIYGNCGSLKCSNENAQCDQMVKNKYYFYLAFENSFSEDYVTEKLLRALQYDTVPIVFGAANYTRFMPNGIYLNARELGVKVLAKKMNELIRNPEKYADLFRWKNHYTYHAKSESVETDEYCLFCDILNDADRVKKKTVYENFRQWWDPPGRC